MLSCVSVPPAGQPVSAGQPASCPDIVQYSVTHVHQRTALSLPDDDGMESDAVSVTTYSQVMVFSDRLHCHLVLQWTDCIELTEFFIAAVVDSCTTVQFVYW